MKRLTIIRGLPGAGKSTKIQQLFPGATPAPWAPPGTSPIVVSGDHFYTDFTTGEYRFDPSRLGEAHAQAMVYAIKAMAQGVPDIIVDNTHVRKWEWKVAETTGRAFGYEIDIIDVFDGGCTDEELAARNTHGVPLPIIASMRLKWERV